MFTFATHLEVFGLCCICVVRNWFHVIAVTASVVTHSTNLGDTCSFSYCIDLLILLYVCDNDLVCVCVLILLCLYCFHIFRKRDNLLGFHAMPFTTLARVPVGYLDHPDSYIDVWSQDFHGLWHSVH